MVRKIGKNSIDIEALREFCEREGEEVTYRKGEQFECERLRVGELAREWATLHDGSASSTSPFSHAVSPSTARADANNVFVFISYNFVGLGTIPNYKKQQSYKTTKQ